MTVKEFETTINSEYQSIIKKLSENLISMFVIGTMKNPQKKLEQYNDYDLRIVVREMNIDTYNLIHKLNENIKNLVMKKNDFSIDYSFLIGPVRHITKCKTNLLIHCLPMTLESLDSLPNTHKYSYSCNYRILYGEDILKKYNKIKFTGNDIIECTEGINYCIEMIVSNQIRYAEWIKQNNEMKLVDKTTNMDEKMLFEVLRYSISKSLHNTMTWNKWNNRKEYDELESSLKEIDKNINDATIYQMKELIQCNFGKYQQNKEMYKEKTLDILSKIKKYIVTYQ